MAGIPTDQAINELRRISNLNGLFRWIKSRRLSKLGEGAFRFVYALNSEAVLKLEEGHDSNKKEVQAYECLTSKYATSVIAHDTKHYMWLVAERVKAVPSEKMLGDLLKQHLSLTKQQVKELKKYVWWKESDATSFDPYSPSEFLVQLMKPTTNIIERIPTELRDQIFGQSQWLQGLLGVLKKCRIWPDLHTGNWGIRQSTEELVLLDYGEHLTKRNIKDFLREIIEREISDNLDIYHFSNINKPSLLLNPTKFGLGSYTKREQMVSGVPRLFFYLDRSDKEDVLGNNLYSTEVSKEGLYDLTKDPNNIKDKFRNKLTGFLDFDQLLKYISGWEHINNGWNLNQNKQLYKGLLYKQPNNVQIVVWFNPIEVFRTES